MPTFPNQYVFKLDRKNSSKPGEFFQLMVVATIDASSVLPGEVPFKLWVYLHSYANGFELNFSTKDFCNKWNVSTESANRAIKILGAYGYIEFYSSRRGRFINYYSPEEKEKQKEVSLTFLKSEFAKTSKKDLKRLFYKRITELTGESDTAKIEREYFGNKNDSSESTSEAPAILSDQSLIENQQIKKPVNNKLIDILNKSSFNFGG